MRRSAPPEHEAWGRERWPGGGRLPRHRHREPYAALVLAGGYEEAGDGGRRRVGPGDVLLHDGFEAHLDQMEARGAETLNLPLPPGWTSTFRHGRVSDLDGVARAAERSRTEAIQILLAALAPRHYDARDWPDLLASALSAGGRFRLGDWARSHGLAPATVSHGFMAVYGVTPSRYRLEARARCAWGLIVRGGVPFAAVADEAGFADQSHMTRAVVGLTGITPAAWRTSNAFKTASVRSA